MSGFGYLARDIASRLHHCASYVSRDYGSGVIADLREIANANQAEQKTLFDARRLEILASYGFDSSQCVMEKPFAYANGVAIIPIHGMLINRLSWSYSFATGYNFIRSQRMAAMADPDVKLIVYDVNSPGGVASGCAELAREMFDSRGEKPSLSVVDARCYSAAYFLASAADRLVVTPSGGTGSIGCVAMHIDYSGMLDAEGLKITFIFAGAEKVDGNPYQGLSSRAQASIQRDVDYHYGIFVEAVARHRDLSEDDIRATEAGCFLPPEALDLGLIDAVQTPAEAVSTFFNEITSDSEDCDDGTTERGVDQMTTQNNTAAAPAVAAAAPVAMTAEQIQAAIASGVATALAAEKARTVAIKTCDEAKDRPKFAAHIAENTSMSVDEAKALLSASAKETAEEQPKPKPAFDDKRPASAFAAAMDATPNPNVGADAAGDAGGSAESTEPVAISSRLMANYTKATGRKMVAAA